MRISAFFDYAKFCIISKETVMHTDKCHNFDNTCVNTLDIIFFREEVFDHDSFCFALQNFPFAIS